MDIPFEEAAKNMLFTNLSDPGIGRWLSMQDLVRDDLKLVWFCKTLQNWKAIIHIPKIPNSLFEVTFDGEKGMVYIDTYFKVNNQEFVYQDHKPKPAAPVSPRELEKYDHLSPEEAAAMAWYNPGPNMDHHLAMKNEVKMRMPLLARALDRNYPRVPEGPAG